MAIDTRILPALLPVLRRQTRKERGQEPVVDAAPRSE